jgi:O-6-methylguanine DNA methyltransferase
MAGSARGSHPDFRARVIRAVRRIPAGQVATYGDIASVAGRPRAWRAVGTIMRTCDQPGVPCHRVIASGGRLGGYSGSEALKAGLLRAEGIVVANGRIRQFKTVRWKQQPVGPGLAKAGPKRRSGAQSDPAQACCAEAGPKAAREGGVRRAEAGPKAAREGGARRAEAGPKAAREGGARRAEAGPKAAREGGARRAEAGPKAAREGGARRAEAGPKAAREGGQRH